jgi:hypothetical protein
MVGWRRVGVITTGLQGAPSRRGRFRFIRRNVPASRVNTCAGNEERQQIDDVGAQ